MKSSQPVHSNVSSAASIEVRVRYFETDQMQIAHHTHYLVWFEAARSELCRVRGIDYGQMERDGMILPLAEAHVRYLKPARYDDLLTVGVRLVDIRRSLMRLTYTVKRGDELLCTGETLQVLVDPKTGSPRSFPADIAEKFLASPPDAK